MLAMAGIGHREWERKLAGSGKLHLTSMLPRLHCLLYLKGVLGTLSGDLARYLVLAIRFEEYWRLGWRN
jgi:hypothetical protein